MYQLFGYRQSGSSAVEIALCLCGVPYRRVDAYSTEDNEAAKELQALNPQMQVPTLLLPDGSVLTEAAAILIHLGLVFPESKLLPDDPTQRAQAIRGLIYIVANCYTPIGIIDFPERWLVDADEATRQQLVSGTRQRLHRNWGCLPTSLRPALFSAVPSREHWISWPPWSRSGKTRGRPC